MNTSIQNIIIESLSQADYVCIPELGTFLVQKEASKIDYKLGTALPPSKRVVFNSEMKADTQGLKNLLIGSHHISEEVAVSELNEFTKSVTQELYSNGSYHFQNLGTLLLSNETLRFEQDHNINIDNESFGLPKINFSQYLNQNLKLRPSMSKTESSSLNKNGEPLSRNKMVWAWVLTPIVIAVASVGFLWENRQDHSYASVNPFYTSKTEKDLAKAVEKGDFNYDDPMGRNTTAEKVEQAEKVNASPSSTTTSDSNIPVAKEDDFATLDQENLAKSTVVVKSGELVSAKSDLYYVIYASYKTLKKAEMIAKELEEKGFESVKILEPHGNVDRYRIALMALADKAEAHTKAKELRPLHGEDIWVYKY